MKLKNEIQKSMIFILVTTLLVAYVLTTALVYRQTVGILEEELEQEADYIKEAIEISGDGYLQEMDAVAENTRVTLISEDGEVLYDSEQDEVTFQNHKDRPEIKEAMKNGTGHDIRESDSVGKQMVYYAVRLSDNTVLRASKTTNSMLHTAMGILPMMGVIAVVMIGLAAYLVHRQVRKLIHPINNLNLETPLDNEIYAELEPLLVRIDEQNKQKEAIAEMRKEFSANVSHELKTPLTSISGYAEIMKNGLVRQEDIPVFSERIYKEANRLVTLIGDIIKLSKLDEGKVELEKENINLYILTRDIVTRLSSVAAAKKVQIELTGDSVEFRGVRQVLDEMIYNLCENAIKYNKEGGKVKVWAGSTLQGAKVIVEDTGIGIPIEEQGRIFERFYRVDKSHSKATGGTGLGLSIVKHGALLHGIQIHISSQVGRGTRMELDFPSGKAEEKER